MRLFVAAELPEAVRRRLGEAQDRLRHAAIRARWVRPEGIHLTLRFLGEVSQERVAEIDAALRPIAAGHAPCSLEARGIGTFPDRGRPLVIWVGLEGAIERIEALARSLNRALEPLGFARETRPFRAHLTLGRFREAPRGDWRAALQCFVQESFGRFVADRFILYESRLRSDGAVYRELARFDLGGEEIF